MASSQVFNLAVSFKAVITKADWKTKPSWMVVAGADRTNDPDLERFMPSGPTARQSKSLERVIASMCHTLKKWRT